MINFRSVFLQLLATVTITAFSSNTSYAGDYVAYKMDMKRSVPGEPIRKSSILKKVRNKWPGRILHISSDSTRGPDCHIVKSMGEDGEFRVIDVACNG